VKQATNWMSEFTDSRSTARPRSETREPQESASPAHGGESPGISAFEVDLAADRALGIGHAVLRGSLIGFVIVATIAWLIAHVAGYSTWDAVGVAAFAGLWGGPGFGGMMGATLAASRAHD
jgi:hypothetical protein